MSKRFDHDCDNCCYLGSFADDAEEGGWDLYYCANKPLGGSIIARFSSAGPDYASMPLKLYLAHADSVNHAGLAEAERRTRANSLL